MLSLIAAVLATGAVGGMEANVDEGIRAHRMGTSALRLCEQSGEPFAGKVVSVQQIGQEFLFGWRLEPDAVPLSQEALERLAGVCNYVEIGDRFEPAEHIRTVTEARLLGMSIGAASPPMSNGPDIYDFDVRVLTAENFDDPVPPADLAKLTQAIRKADPDAVLVLGLTGVDTAAGAEKLAAYVRQCLDAGAEIDRIGCEVPESYAWEDVSTLTAALDSLASAGKPLHVMGLPVSLAFGWLPELMARKCVEGVVCTGDPEDLPKEAVHNPYSTPQKATTDSDGRVVFTGFYGDYEVVLDGHVWKPRLAKGGPRQFELRKPPTVEPPERFEMPFVAENAVEAKQWQEEVRAKLFDIVSAQNPKHDNPLNVNSGERRQADKYIIQDISFVGNEGQRVEATLTTPLGEGPFPAVVCLHGHGGTREKVHDYGTEFHGFAAEFAKRGFVTIAPSLSHYEYAPNQLWNLMRLVDALETLSIVDAGRIGVAGLSMGGEWTMWLATMDLRIRAAVVSGWMCTTEGVLSIHNCPCWMPPGLLDICDISEVHILVAPRPLLFESAISDGCFPIHCTEEGYRKVLRGYSVFGVPENVRQHTFPGGHAWNGGVAYDFMERGLGK